MFTDIIFFQVVRFENKISYFYLTDTLINKRSIN
jgi:hypothetical protein